jgi:hypothetical protein
MTTQLNTNLTGPELYLGDNPYTGILGFLSRHGNWRDPWRNQKTKTFLGNVLSNVLIPGSGEALLGMQKIESLLDPYGWNKPFHKSEETMEKERQADIASRDDYPAIAKERRRLLNTWRRLGRMADLAAYKAHVRQYG